MKIEVKREEIKDSAELLIRLEQWEKFLECVKAFNYLYAPHKDGEIRIVGTVGQNLPSGSDLQDKVINGVSAIVRKKLEETAKEVIAFINGNVPLPLQK